MSTTTTWAQMPQETIRGPLAAYVADQKRSNPNVFICFIADTFARASSIAAGVAPLVIGPLGVVTGTRVDILILDKSFDPHQEEGWFKEVVLPRMKPGSQIVRYDGDAPRFNIDLQQLLRYLDRGWWGPDEDMTLIIRKPNELVLRGKVGPHDDKLHFRRVYFGTAPRSRPLPDPCLLLPDPLPQQSNRLDHRLCGELADVARGLDPGPLGLQQREFHVGNEGAIQVQACSCHGAESTRLPTTVNGWG